MITITMDRPRETHVIIIIMINIMIIIIIMMIMIIRLIDINYDRPPRGILLLRTCSLLSFGSPLRSRMPIHTYIHTCMHIYIYKYTHIHIYIYTYVCVYIYIYIHTYCNSDLYVFIAVVIAQPIAISFKRVAARPAVSTRPRMPPL